MMNSEKSTCSRCAFHTQYDEYDCECEKLGLSKHYKYCWMSGGTADCPLFELDEIFKNNK